ncbi:MAG: hypothetical protein A3B86_01280 [Candidatus Yanofskybacteria bacterium RIFCSPHIGHO2_02_FULL_38_22b]|uniref:Glycerol-3-phosphate acyltransferase n=1 Tax=Candidatus Yanofskybacteria bacterium RIFCSPHIGHO2_02_FULL_38_22b TaxID=1802673 RepID=A0A1F8F545_9BACT|nr:MAG: hypothetical protein A3B86_01280 [Candidatus Yanofskybacteria bacterium RIFCSPHIGHO2_02_FULL_38_22b]OGN20420.1 MAG: hypothetical protein A2910_01625 [Candidatus Yanofskybacteria bacterium RIFCSPLOWO2_01_FULL_39_28]
MVLFFLILIGYLIGSLSPGFFFGWVVKGIDVRNYGYHNTGTTNTYHHVGPVYGVLTAIFDLLKTSVIYYISLNWLNVDLAILPGLAGVVGHVLPFYLEFRGGRGVASLAGLSLIALFYSQSLLVLLLVVGSLVYGIKIATIKVNLPIRHMLKLGALVFPIGLIWFSSNLIIFILLTLFGISIFLDILRFLNPKINEAYLRKSKFTKLKEKSQFSGYTLFILGALFVVISFPLEIAVMSLCLFIVGDVLAPFSKMIRFLPQKVLLSGPCVRTGKTPAGAIVISTLSFVTGVFLNSLTPLSLSLNFIFIGAILTAVIDQFSFILDDNLLVPIGTAFILWLVFV